MRPRWRLPGTTLGIVVLVFATAYAAIVIAFPPDRLALLLSQQVKAATGRDFKVGGQLSIHLLPTISVHANDIVLGNVEWGSRPEMVRMRHAAFEAATSALLHGQLKILRVDIEGVDALLQSDDSGRSNWQFKPQADSPLRTSENGWPSGNQTPRIELSRLVASDVHVAYWTYPDLTDTLGLDLHFAAEVNSAVAGMAALALLCISFSKLMGDF